MVEYYTRCWGQRYAVRADWARASDTVETRYEDGKWTTSPHQVAEFRHRPAEALRWFISADEPDEPAVAKAVAKAVDKAVAK